METTTTTPAPVELIPAGPTLLQPLRQRDFRLLFSGESISLLGDQFHFVALAFLTLQLTGSGLALGTVLMTAAVPRAVLMLVGGALSDRASPRSLMLASNAVRAVVVGILAALVLTGSAELWHLYVLAAIFGVVGAFFYPAMNTIVPMLVTERLLPPANALVQGIHQLATLIGPAAAGVLVAAVQTGPAFAIDAASFAVAALVLVGVRGGRRRPRTPSPDGAPAEQGLLADIGSGLAFAWRDPAVRSLVLLTAAVNFGFTGPMSVGLPYLADTRFDGAASFGLIVSAFGAGALGGTVLAGSLRRIRQLGLVTMAVAGCLGIGLALVGNAPSVPVAMVAMAAIGMGAGFINVRVIAWLQARTPQELRGRVMSLVMLGSWGLAPVSLVLAGLVIDFGAVTLLFSSAGAVIVAAAMVGILSGVPSRMQDQAAT